MRRRVMLGVALAIVVGLAALPAVANADHPGHLGRTWSRTLTATLTGSGEVPPVATEASGLFRVTIDRRKHLLCYEGVITGMEPVAGHIHKAPPGENGGPVVDLAAIGEPLGSSTSGCVTGIGAALLRDIVQTPKQFYINMHSDSYPGGEIRGQLAER